MVVALIFILFLALYLSGKKTLFFLTLTTIFLLLRPVLLKIGIVPPMLNYLVLGLSFVFVFVNFNKYQKFIITFIICYIAYFLLKALTSPLPFIEGINTYKNCIVALGFSIEIVESIKFNRLNSEALKRLLYFLLAYEIIIGWAQYLSPSFLAWFPVTYDWGGEQIGTGLFQEVMGTSNSMIGTFISPVSYSGFMALLIGILVTYDIQNHNIDLKRLGFYLLGCLTLVFTAIRTPFFVLMVYILFLVYRYEKRKFLPLFAIAIGIVFIVITRAAVGNESLGRMQEGALSIFSKGNEGLMETTLGYSIMMIKYIFQNPLFGISLHSSTGYALSAGFTIEDISTTDTQFVFTLCEIGIIGVMLYIAPMFLFRFKKYSKYISTLHSPILLVALLLSIVDLGIFSIDILFLYSLSYSLYVIKANHYA